MSAPNPFNRNWELLFQSWGMPPSATEQAKCENAERAVRKAIDANVKLSAKSIKVFAQGSYANRTNVRQDSDVDLCVLCTDVFFPEYKFSDGLDDRAVRSVDATYHYPEFKNDVEAALQAYFGKAAVTRGSKAFGIHANTYRIDADVVPCFEHCRYGGNQDNYWITRGTQFLSDGRKIVNWPQQNYDNGVEKNEATGRRFKAVTRILKCLRNEMADNGHETAKPISSFLIESLVWNVPNLLFNTGTHAEDLSYVIAHLWGKTRTDDDCWDWGEINELKYLFRGTPGRREQVHNFLRAAWEYVDFE